MAFAINKLGKGIALASLMVAAGTAYSANDGSLGATSTGDLTVSVDIANRVQISGLNDIDFGTYAGSGDLERSDDFCVYRNGTGSYNVTISSSQAEGGSFRLVNGPNAIPYSVRFNDAADITGGSDVSSGDTLAGTGSATSLTCGGSSNASLGVSIAASALQAAPSGFYTDVITLLVEPN
ncbi:MAG: spore coat protein U domain-containing protein [Gammaproteobacteria bacterium]|nr:spore coat protein U domain-containing protein [Gammaproteobacteria bacterium]